ncbi:uncharacterized protein VTP21DRAFT_2868 [Calcarisporiella thermophila]|uniref:uncharacterized protein n=1 Tax=Calcarisporiella thermophila TaxID=911321 RepID=UPI003742BE0C
MSTQVDPSPKQHVKEECRLAEIVQYQCKLVPNKIVCSPFPRLFRICPGKPTIEVTHAYSSLGEPHAKSQIVYR